MTDDSHIKVKPAPAKSLKRKRAFRLEPIITRLQYKLMPLHPLPQGAPHPAFPASLLHYFLLTEDQLDSMAQYYHQSERSPCIWTYEYPATMNWDPDFLQHLADTEGGEACCRVKRRKVGKFIGLRGCETPIAEIDKKMDWLESRMTEAVKSPGEFGLRKGFKRW